MMKRVNANASTSDTEDIKYWKVLWKLNVPPKVRSFWWHVIRGFIPCRQVLNRRHMDELAFYKTCGVEEESIFHAFFECTWAKIFWQELKKITATKIPVLHPRSWATYLTDSAILPHEESGIILCSCWAIWNERNAAVWHESSGRTVTSSVRWVT